VGGELVGGLDIMKQMIENGEFQAKFTKTKANEIITNSNKYLESLTKQAPLMLFIKGTKDAPKCGFTKELLQLLDKAQIGEYKTFNILEDENVRQKLKEYSSWQTYPQIYAHGQFIGGLDIIKQLYETGQLEQTLNVSKGQPV